MCCITHHAPSSLGERFYLSPILSLLIDQILIRPVLYFIQPYFNKISDGFHTFSYAATFLWNHLPTRPTVRSAFTYLSSRRDLETYLFNQAFPT